ncbi:MULTISPECIES: ABC transporter ATP-binding protein [unclassified Halorubrum]|uniref:ABC transporter ATP-binding protein n=1 Tax=unclassified Halorubrum TaxID=2642239 RepID=UPI0010F763DD|nr:MULTISPECIES: ABC transporter ATP-binding protein [unclassified Halorubrum]TKX45040.1 ABC transporter ATP-binding protein [Halorubrum sp. ARQ200]TKX48814.1 ABC transporter ATP-binding protein [Halorubrum sp. ASP121]
MSDRTLAALDGVTRTYSGVAVLDEVSLSVGTGVTAVIGPNGSGKSTLLGVLSGAVEPTAGTVRYPEGGPRSGSEKRVGYLPQRVPFRDGFTARETLGFYAALAGGDPDAALAAVGLSDAAGKRVADLSGGMRRLLGIAQARLGDPDVVVLDEPTSGLDPEMRERAFRAAARAGDDAAVVVSSHDLDLVDAHADAVVVLRRGRVAAAGRRERLLDERGVDDVAALYHAVAAGTDGASSPAGGGAEEGGESGGADAESVHVTGVSDR